MAERDWGARMGLVSGTGPEPSITRARTEAEQRFEGRRLKPDVNAVWHTDVHVYDNGDTIRRRSKNSRTNVASNLFRRAHPIRLGRQWGGCVDHDVNGHIQMGFRAVLQKEGGSAGNRFEELGQPPQTLRTTVRPTIESGTFPVVRVVIALSRAMPR